MNIPIAVANAAGLSQVPKHLPQVTFVEVTPKPTSIIAMYMELKPPAKACHTPPIAARTMQTLTVFFRPNLSVIIPRIMLNAIAGIVPALNIAEYCCSPIPRRSISLPATGAI